MKCCRFMSLAMKTTNFENIYNFKYCCYLFVCVCYGKFIGRLNQGSMGNIDL